MQYGRLVARRIGVKIALLNPEVVKTGLGLLGVILFGEFGEVHAIATLFETYDRALIRIAALCSAYVNGGRCSTISSQSTTKSVCSSAP